MARPKRHRSLANATAGPLTPEEQLKLDRDAWYADVYKHFQPAQIAKDDKGNIECYNGEINYLFVCRKYVPQIQLL